MRGRLLLICWLLLCLNVVLPFPVLAATGSAAVDAFHVRPPADCPNNGDGLAYGCAASPGASGAWSGLQNVVWTGTTGVDDGDTLYVAGTHTGYLTAGSSAAGTAALPITINFTYPSDPGTIRNITAMPEALVGANWTEESPGIWRMSLSTWTWKDPRRLWTDSTERMRASVKASLGTSEGGPTAVWWYDSGNARLYFYSVANPSTTFSLMESLVGGSGTGEYGALSFVAAANQYFNIIDPNLQGGNFASLVKLGSHISVTGSATDYSACHIGAYANRGVNISDTQTDGTGTPASHIRVQGCTVASLIPSEFDNFTWQCCTSEGINIVNGASEIDIEDNLIKNWTHAQIQTAATLGTGAVTDVRITHNHLLCESHIEYCRGFNTDGAALDRATRISYTRNLLEGMSIRSQLNGNGNTYVANVCLNQRLGTVNLTAAQCFDLEGYAGPSQDGLLASNTCLNNPYGAFLQIQSGANTKSGWRIIDNLSENCGGSEGQVTGSAGAAIAIESAASVGNNEYRNNLLYNSGTTSTIFYKGTGLTTVAAFQAACSGDTCAGNISSNPLLLTDGRTGANSPARRAGVPYLGCIDHRGRVCWSPPDIGAYQASRGDPANTRTAASNRATASGRTARGVVSVPGYILTETDDHITQEADDGFVLREN